MFTCTYQRVIGREEDITHPLDTCNPAIKFPGIGYSEVFGDNK